MSRELLHRETEEAMTTIDEELKGLRMKLGLLASILNASEYRTDESAHATIVRMRDVLDGYESIELSRVRHRAIDQAAKVAANVRERTPGLGGEGDEWVDCCDIIEAEILELKEEGGENNTKRKSEPKIP